MRAQRTPVSNFHKAQLIVIIHTAPLEMHPHQLPLTIVLPKQYLYRGADQSSLNADTW
jgi:hypothetical protein